MKDKLERLLRYDVWANRETLTSLELPQPPARSLQWMAHIIGAEHLWLARLQGESPSMAVWPDLTVSECDQRLGELARHWERYLNSISDSRLLGRIAYTNSKGEAWSSTVEDILTHVPIHSAYHRGQIASDLRAAGQVPAYTDYVHAVRQGFVA